MARYGQLIAFLGVWLFLIWYWGSRGMGNGAERLYRDAFRKTSATQTLGQRFALQVFGEPNTPPWLLWVYAITASLSYPLFLSFATLETLYAFDVFSVYPCLVIFFWGSLLSLGIPFVLLFWFWGKNGPVGRRVAQFWKANPKPPTGASAKVEGLPFWWLYGTSRTQTVLLLVPALIPFLSAFSAMYGFYVAFSGETLLRHGPNWENQLFAGGVLVLWILIGWLLPLDGVLKLASWRGDGLFSEAILANELAWGRPKTKTLRAKKKNRPLGRR